MSVRLLERIIASAMMNCAPCGRPTQHVYVGVQELPNTGKYARYVAAYYDCTACKTTTLYLIPRTPSGNA